jgi:uncharacterized protein YbcC (UPF0753/DUF2309 family)
MDYSENIAENISASRASDFLYAKWYAQQPETKKADMFVSACQLVESNIRQQVEATNPFATEADVTLRFIELTQKTDYSPEMLKFIEENMAKRSEIEWQKRFKVMKKSLDWTYEDIASFMCAENGASVKSSVNRQLPAFAKLAVCVFEKMNKTIKE